MRRLRGKLTYANVISTIALFLVVSGGAAYAANLGKNSVGSKQIKSNAVTAAKIKKGTITGAQVKSGSLTGTQINASTLGTVPNSTHATNAETATNAGNATTLGGQSASAFAPTSVVRSMVIEGNGTVIASKSSGITQTNVTHPATGIYCINGLNPAPKTAIAQFSFDASYHAQIFIETNPNHEADCENMQVGIATYNEKNEPADMNITVILH
jgi:hypothetical protein